MLLLLLLRTVETRLFVPETPHLRYWVLAQGLTRATIEVHPLFSEVPRFWVLQTSPKNLFGEN